MSERPEMSEWVAASETSAQVTDMEKGSLALMPDAPTVHAPPPSARESYVHSANVARSALPPEAA